MSVTPVRIQGGAVSIGGRPVLRGIDLEIREGEFVVLLGANGSGKSTLVRACTGLLPTTHGSLHLFDTPIGRFRDWQRVGYVPQRASAGSGVPASVWEVVASGRLTRRRLLRPLGRVDRRAIDDALETVGLADRARDGVSQLSGGQQQRVLIARALAGEPELFFLDEPNAGVDVENQQALADALRALHARGSTLVTVLHELGPIAPLTQRAVVLSQGRIVHDGPVDAAPGTVAAMLTGHVHHHGETDVAVTFAPQLSAPLDTPPEEAR
ncbi:metal ABC transporter ATP-binding protein [Nocardioides sp. R-C-SC26]|uniref:metal ABC transporter ATP-binding protein n=1 Tax=Nocardioides sp. R-C-SC26 TaxID=2870414 RepID=UPI001E4EF5F4|nr:ATP-binding cassette domain-containing protein [Nocardioides sp. R-C-SC26]